MLFSYRRHQRSCRKRAKGRNYHHCRCPVWVDGHVDGQRIHRSLGTTDWAEAQRLVWDIQTTDQTLRGASARAFAQKPRTNHARSASDSSLSREIIKEPVSLCHAWDRYISGATARNRKLSSTTIYKYNLLRRQMQGFAQKRGIALLRDFNLDRVEQFLAEWTEGPITCQKKLERLSAFMNAAVLRGWIDSNPTVVLPKTKTSLRPTLPFTKAQMAAILTAANRFPDKSGKTGRSNAVRLRAFILTLRYSGLRIGDVTKLQVAHLQGNKLFLYTQKTNVPVFCLLPNFVVEALLETPRLSERYFFWTGVSTLHTAIGTWQRTLRRLFQLAGLEGHAHRFRDTFSVELLLAGVPMEDVSVLLGHSSVKITQKHYSPWVLERQERLESNLRKAWEHDPIVRDSGAAEKTAILRLVN